jgi:hypothetical protein
MGDKEGEEDVIGGIKMVRGKIGRKIPIDILYIPFGDERYPATGLGFTGSKRGIFPEYKLRKKNEKDREYQGGDMLYVIDAKMGEARTTYEYNKKDSKWIEREKR